MRAEAADEARRYQMIIHTRLDKIRFIISIKHTGTRRLSVISVIVIIFIILVTIVIVIIIVTIINTIKIQ